MSKYQPDNFNVTVNMNCNPFYFRDVTYFYFILSLIPFWLKITDFKDNHFLFGITCTDESFTIRLDKINLDCKYIFEIGALWSLRLQKKKREHELKIDNDKIRIMIFYYFVHLFLFLLIHCHLPCIFSFSSLLASFHQAGVWTLHTQAELGFISMPLILCNYTWFK